MNNLIQLADKEISLVKSQYKMVGLVKRVNKQVSNTITNLLASKVNDDINKQISEYANLLVNRTAGNKILQTIQKNRLSLILRCFSNACIYANIETKGVGDKAVNSPGAEKTVVLSFSHDKFLSSKQLKTNTKSIASYRNRLNVYETALKSVTNKSYSLASKNKSLVSKALKSALDEKFKAWKEDLVVNMLNCSKEINQHFLAGVIDGDGTFNKKSNRIER